MPIKNTGDKAMRAWVLEEFGSLLRLRDVSVPTIAPHEVLVRIWKVDICGTALKIRAGRMGLNVLLLIMGHEIAGEVAEAGSQVQGIQPGDRVM
jgi:D-arabinose 1-dehydrogenase-like Zn-dependent alcohol dehydrogenase